MTTIARAIATCWIASSLLFTCGCGETPRAADSAQARTALQVALDAWKAGESPEDLARRAPPLHVRDTDWNGGFRLVGYDAGAEGRRVGYDMNYPVVLELKNPKGRLVKKNAVYTVTTSPELVVLRHEG